MNTYTQRLSFLLALLSPLLTQLPAQAQTKPIRTELATTAQITGAKPASIMWVGNSFFYYNNSLHNHFGQLVASSSTPDKRVSVRSSSVTISGSGIDWHDMNSLLRDNGIGRYSFVGDNEIRFNPPGRQFDTVIMMDCSQCPIHPQLQSVFHDTVRQHSATLAKAGIRPVLFMSWAYKDKPEMTAQLAEAYTVAANANNALVIPAGLAFATAIAKDPTLELYVADKRHPSLAGTYLAAATSYAALYRQSPVGLSYTAGLPSPVVQLLQTTAWEVVQAYTSK